MMAKLTEAQGIINSVKKPMANIPAPELKSYWAALTDLQKQQIQKAIQANPANLAIIVARLKEAADARN